MNKEEFLRKLKDPVEWAVLKAFEDVERIFPFVVDTHVFILNEEQNKKIGATKAWHVDISIDMDKHREWDPCYQDIDLAGFATSVRELLGYRITVYMFALSDYHFDTQKITAVFNT